MPASSRRRPGMRVNSDSIGDVLVVMPEGRIDGESAHQFRRLMEASIGEESGGVIVDCKDLQELTSAGLSAFLVIARQMEDSGTVFALCSLTPRIAGILQVTGFDRILPICATRDEAFQRVKT